MHGPVSDEDILVLPLDLTEFGSHKTATATVINHFSQVRVDFMDQDHVSAFVIQNPSRFSQIDVLVNNGGRSQRAWIKDTSLEVDRDMLDLNVLGQISLTKAVLPFMQKQKSGMVMVNSSIVGKMGKAPLSEYVPHPVS